MLRLCGDDLNAWALGCDRLVSGFYLSDSFVIFAFIFGVSDLKNVWGHV